jgi:hypothetical protein
LMVKSHFGKSIPEFKSMPKIFNKELSPLCNKLKK